MKPAINRFLKEALFFNKPKWQTDPNWMDDPDAVSDFYDQYWEEKNNHILFKPAVRKWNSLSEDVKNQLMLNNNAFNRITRHDDVSAKLLDRAARLKFITPMQKQVQLKMDRDDVMEDLHDKLYETVNKYNKLENPYFLSSRLRDLDRLDLAVHDYLCNRDRTYPRTRTDVGSLRDATPHQIEKWKRDANTSLLGHMLRGVFREGHLPSTAYYLGQARQRQAQARLAEI